MKLNFISKSIWILWIGGFLILFLLTVVSGGTFSGVVFRLLLNAVLLFAVIAAVKSIWTRFLKDSPSDTLHETPHTEENEPEDEIILESEDNSGYNKKETESFNKFSPGDAFSAYKYREDEEGSNLNYKDSQNPYQMSDALLRKFKAEEEDSIAKFKAAFQSPEEIAKAVRTEMHKDG